MGVSELGLGVKGKPGGSFLTAYLESEYLYIIEPLEYFSKSPYRILSKKRILAFSSDQQA